MHMFGDCQKSVRLPFCGEDMVVVNTLLLNSRSRSFNYEMDGEKVGGL